MLRVSLPSTAYVAVGNGESMTTITVMILTIVAFWLGTMFTPSRIAQRRKERLFQQFDNINMLRGLGRAFEMTKGGEESMREVDRWEGEALIEAAGLGLLKEVMKRREVPLRIGATLLPERYME